MFTIFPLHHTPRNIGGGGATPTKNAWWDSEVWLFYLLISRYYAHRIVTCVKQNNVIICLYDLMPHTLINKILNVNIME